MPLDNDANDLLAQYLDGSGQFKKAEPANAAPLPAPAETPAAQTQAHTAEAEPDTAQESDQSALDYFATRARSTASRAVATANRTQDWIAAQPTPGGIAPLLFALAIFLLAIVPVSGQGYTRLQLLFYSVLGRTGLQGRRVALPPAALQSGGGSWSDNPSPGALSAPAVPRTIQDVGSIGSYSPLDFSSSGSGF